MKCICFCTHLHENALILVVKKTKNAKFEKKNENAKKRKRKRTQKKNENAKNPKKTKTHIFKNEDAYFQERRRKKKRKRRRKF